MYGFISIPDSQLFDILESPAFQRLRYIKQLGLTHLVYPGALHTRFQHALGSMHLMHMALESLINKGVHISKKERVATVIAILMHDLGHGPYSHALENFLIKNVSHERITLLLMKRLQKFSPDHIDLAIDIFKGCYTKKFLHQLVSGQLDMDRLDYLNRDSFFSGVSEGVVSYDRIIKTLNVADDKLVTDQKGIYSLEKFIIARRLMYWQVYLHKTVITAEQILTQVVKRANEYYKDTAEIPEEPILMRFIRNPVKEDEFENDQRIIDNFLQLDDNDVFYLIKKWMNHPDIVISELSRRLIERRLFHIDIQKEPFQDDYLEELKQKTSQILGLSNAESKYFVINGIAQNNAYDPGIGNIWILQKNGKVKDLAEISDQLNIRVLSKPVTKYFVCYPKEIIPF